MTLIIRFFFKIIAFFLAFSLFFIVLLALIGFLTKGQKLTTFEHIEGNKNSPNKIALLKLKGPILNQPNEFNEIDFFENFERIYTTQVKEILDSLKNENIKGLIISLNSPGGSVVASYNIYNLIRNFKKENNIEIFFHTDEIIASGAYWVASAGTKIYANYGSLIGSIGVKGPDWIYYDSPMSFSTGILGSSIETKNGIKKFTSTAGKSKDIFDPFREPTQKEIQELQMIVKNIYEDFVNDVSKNRKIENDFIVNIIGAMIYEAKTAKKKSLIDDVIDFELVIKKVSDYLSLDDYQLVGIKKNQQISLYNFISNKFLSTDVKKIQNSDVCNILKFGISSIVIQSKFASKC